MIKSKPSFSKFGYSVNDSFHKLSGQIRHWDILEFAASHPTAVYSHPSSSSSTTQCSCLPCDSVNPFSQCLVTHGCTLLLHLSIMLSLYASLASFHGSHAATERERCTDFPTQKGLFSLPVDISGALQLLGILLGRLDFSTVPKTR